MENKKVIVIYYSRTGTTKKVAQAIADNLSACGTAQAGLKCDIEEIIDTKNRKGLFGWLRSGSDAMKERLAVIKEIKHNPASYDIIIMGTPVWGAKIVPAIRTYITQNKESLKNVAFFCTAGGSGEKALENLENFIGRKPVFSFGVRRREVASGGYVQKIKEFFDKVKI
jgi:flavodoxin